MHLLVRFLPQNVTVEVTPGTTVLEAAYHAGVMINSICGGKGTCGKCRVIVQGDAESFGGREFFSEDEWKAGYRLACRTRIHGNVEILVPEEIQIASHQILTSYIVERLGKLSPLSSARYFELSPPTLDDNLADLERLRRSLLPSGGDLFTTLRVLRVMPRVLRESRWKVTAVLDESGEVIGLIGLRPGNAAARNFGIAVDIGTTTVVLSLVDLTTGNVIAQASNYNKQIMCGEDVLSRITYAEEGGLSRLNQLIIETINYLIAELCNASENCEEIGGKVSAHEISSMAVAGNTTMIHLFLGLDPRYIRYEPYVPSVSIPPIYRAHEIGVNINPDAPVYCVPSRASYVGGDITADVVASGMHLKSEIAMLIDVGTNGEVVLGNSDWLISCSCSAGPAFEGGEVRYGMRAMSGAIERVRILENYDVKYSTIGGTKPRGICGSGLIDLIAEMFLRGLIDKKGHIQQANTSRVRRGEDGMEFVIAWANETAIGKDKITKLDGEQRIVVKEEKGRDIVITENDIANIIRTKAAVYAACCVLLRKVNLSFDDVSKVYIAGGFGNYIDMERAIAIGLLPDLPFNRFVFLGNAALAGAYLTLLSKDKRVEAQRVYEMMTYLELSTTQMFFDEFSSALFLPHTDISRFPTVAELIRKV